MHLLIYQLLCKWFHLLWPYLEFLQKVFVISSIFQYHVYSLFVRASLIMSKIFRASVCPYLTEIFTGMISAALAFCGRIMSPPRKSKSNKIRIFVFFMFFPLRIFKSQTFWYIWIEAWTNSKYTVFRVSIVIFAFIWSIPYAFTNVFYSTCFLNFFSISR